MTAQEIIEQCARIAEEFAAEERATPAEPEDGISVDSLAGSEAAGLIVAQRIRALSLQDHAPAVETRLRTALRDLHAVVKGECPSLLNEDSGGDARLALEIEALLSEERALPNRERLVEIVRAEGDGEVGAGMPGSEPGVAEGKR